MAEKKLMTVEGLKKLQDELDDRMLVQRKEIAEKIKEAREQGDLSENAEYDAARDEQRDNEARILELENLIKNAEVIEEGDIDRSHVHIGSIVKLLDMEYQEEIIFQIVGSAEVNSLENKISNESTLGKELMGRSVGEEFEVDSMGYVSKYKILEVNRE